MTERPALLRIAELIQKYPLEYMELDAIWNDTNMFICIIVRTLEYADYLPPGLVEDLKLSLK